MKNPKHIQLLFRASEYKFSTSKFHELCDKIPNSLVLIKTEFGKIIGGFNSLGWNSQLNGYSADNSKKTFLFSVSLKQKFDLIQPMGALYSNPAYGPTFGGGFDIYVSHDCAVNKNSYSNFPHSYNLASKPYTNNP